MWLIPELSFSQPVLSLLIDSLKNEIRRVKTEINIIYWGKLPSGQRNLKPLRFCPIANAWQMIISMYLQGYGLLQGRDNLQPERVFVPASHGRCIQMTQTTGRLVHWGREILYKIIYFLNCWYSPSKLAWCKNAEYIMQGGNYTLEKKTFKWFHSSGVQMLVMNFMLPSEFELDKITVKKWVGIAYLQDRADQMYCISIMLICLKGRMQTEWMTLLPVQVLQNFFSLSYCD